MGRRHFGWLVTSSTGLMSLLLLLLLLLLLYRGNVWRGGRHIANIICINKSSVAHKLFFIIRHDRCSTVPGLAFSALATLSARPFLPSLLALQKGAAAAATWATTGASNPPPHEPARVIHTWYGIHIPGIYM